LTDKSKKYCKGCGQEVVDTGNTYEMFEGMHWLCFHLAYEHTGSPDEPCDSRLCPIWHLKILKEHLVSSGENPESIINDAVEKHWKAKD